MFEFKLFNYQLIDKPTFEIPTKLSGKFEVEEKNEIRNNLEKYEQIMINIWRSLIINMLKSA
jgi:hypothetical protein